MASGILNERGISLYDDGEFKIFYRDELLMKRELGKADEDIAIGKKVTFSWVIRKAEEWIENHELNNK
jgi:hypothetical protein